MPQVNTLQQCMKNMLASFTKHRHIIHAGYTFAGKGSWILQVEISETADSIGHNSLLLSAQDGTYSFADFTTAFEEYDVQRVIRSYENSISISVHCCQEGEWKQVILLLNFYGGFKGQPCSAASYALCRPTKCLYCGPRLYHSERIMFNSQNEEN